MQQIIEPGEIVYKNVPNRLDKGTVPPPLLSKGVGPEPLKTSRRGLGAATPSAREMPR
jgi:hypothetical protein